MVGLTSPTRRLFVVKWIESDCHELLTKHMPPKAKDLAATQESLHTTQNSLSDCFNEVVCLWGGWWFAEKCHEKDIKSLSKQGEITDNTEMKFELEYCIIPWVFCLTTEHSHCSRWQSFWAQHLDEREAASLPGEFTFGGRWHHWWHLDEIFEWLKLGSFCSQKFNNHINYDSLKSAKIHDFKVRSDLERNVADTEARLKNDIRQKQQEAGSSEWSKLSLIQTPKSPKNELRPLRRLGLSNSKQSWGVAWRTRDFSSIFFLSIGGQLLKVWVLLFLMYEIQDLCSISNFSLSEG